MGHGTLRTRIAGRNCIWILWSKFCLFWLGGLWDLVRVMLTRAYREGSRVALNSANVGRPTQRWIKPIGAITETGFSETEHTLDLAWQGVVHYGPYRLYASGKCRRRYL